MACELMQSVPCPGGRVEVKPVFRGFSVCHLLFPIVFFLPGMFFATLSSGKMS
tara:strand:- start:83 stop:241 length:159 start_codon:yes stop_codon:yes gene_type:complete